MNMELDFSGSEFEKSDVKVTFITKKEVKGKDELIYKGSIEDAAENLNFLKAGLTFKGNEGESFTYDSEDGEKIIIWGLGESKNITSETLRKATSKAFTFAKSLKPSSISFDLDSVHFIKDRKIVLKIIYEAVGMTNYSFKKYFKDAPKENLKSIIFYTQDKTNKKGLQKTLEKTKNVVESVNLIRDFINEAPNVLHSETYAKLVEKDIKENLKGKNVKVKILGKEELKKENCNLFLAVNAGSSHAPRLVHLTYTPKKATKNTKHYALVGKGLTFDSGGYSLKPAGSMMGMKFDMGGSATLYGAFRAAVLNDAPVKISCILGMTDNMVSDKAIMPDAIVQSRNGKYVEILNTDAEGRLVLADCLDYASDLKPDFIVDAATLTGACLVALGSEVCAVLGNNDKFITKVKTSAKESDEYMWELPIINEWRDDMKSKVADLKNIGTPSRAGTATAAAFLENFVGEGIAWAHLDIAGVADSQKHLPYCPTQGASGLIVRTLHHLLTNG